MTKIQPSPFLSHLPKIIQSPVSLVEAPTGTGKSTIFPLSLLEHHPSKIFLIQPRRAAARMLAHRMAFLLSENCGQTVGYQIRHEQRLSTKSQIIVMTEGVLIRRLQNDPFLEGVNTIILDEFHERSIQLDLLLLFSNYLMNGRIHFLLVRILIHIILLSILIHS